MAAALAGHPKLRALDLSDNALGEKGIRAFAAGLTNKVSLPRFDMLGRRTAGPGHA